MAVNIPFGLETTSVTGASSGAISQGAAGSFLGFGIDTPFRRESSDFASVGGIAHLQSMISNVLGTRAGSDYTEGELQWRTEFGSLLHHLRHKNNGPIINELARVYVADALARWIPQIRLKAVSTEKKNDQSGRETILLLKIKYDVIGIRQAGNSVFLSDISQSIALAA